MNKKIKYNELILRKCDEKDIDSILKFQDKIFETIQNPNWLRKNTKEMFKLCTDEPNITLGLYDKNKMIAVIIMYAIHDDEDLSKTLQNNSTNNSANFKVILVDEEYRGNSLMLNLMWVLEKYALSKGYTDLCVTVDPENKYSYTNVLLSGYKYDQELIKEKRSLI